MKRNIQLCFLLLMMALAMSACGRSHDAPVTKEPKTSVGESPGENMTDTTAETADTTTETADTTVDKTDSSTDTADVTAETADTTAEKTDSSTDTTDMSTETTDTTAETTPPGEAASQPLAYTIINPSGETLEERIGVPADFVRTSEDEGSLGAFLRNYPVLPDGSPVLLYDGREKINDSAVCVFDMHLGAKDLQQCADSVIRVYAEYMRVAGLEEKIAFHFVSGFLCDWSSYKSGCRISVNGNDVSWKAGGSASDSDETFENYLETVFNYASTLSVERESEPIDINEIRIGDVFIKGGSPGHVVMVVDTCECDGKKAFLLAQGYMPAQQFHVLKNRPDDPWYYAEEVTYPFWTPEYVFDEGSLKRPEYLK